jgi:hypothetical protein
LYSTDTKHVIVPLSSLVPVAADAVADTASSMMARDNAIAEDWEMSYGDFAQKPASSDAMGTTALDAPITLETRALPY